MDTKLCCQMDFNDDLEYEEMVTDLKQSMRSTSNESPILPRAQIPNAEIRLEDCGTISSLKKSQLKEDVPGSRIIRVEQPFLDLNGTFSERSLSSPILKEIWGLIEDDELQLAVNSLKLRDDKSGEPPEEHHHVANVNNMSEGFMPATPENKGPLMPRRNFRLLTLAKRTLRCPIRTNPQ